MKKLILITFLVMLTTFSSNSQSRENKETVQFISKSEKLTEATGWEQNKETGKWIENKNAIDDRNLKYSYSVSHVSQNFKWMQFATISNGSQKYYVLLYERLGGEYRYPSILEDWEIDLRTYFFILMPEQYNEIKKRIDLKTGENIKITSKMNGHISDRFKILGGEHLYNEENLLSKITNSIEKPGSLEISLIINSQIVNDQEIIRFRLPPEDWYSEKKMEDDIKIKYFELKATDFKTILTE